MSGYDELADGRVLRYPQTRPENAPYSVHIQVDFGVTVMMEELPDGPSVARYFRQSCFGALVPGRRSLPPWQSEPCIPQNAHSDAGCQPGLPFQLTNKGWMER